MKAVIFPGQGSQYAGMGKSFYDNFPLARGIFSKIDNILGFSLSEKCFLGTEQELKDTSIQQLAVLAVSLVSYEIFKTKAVKIDYVSGLSLGEYSCLYAAEVLSLEDLVKLVNLRASAMREAAIANPSVMFAVSGADENLLRDEAKQKSFFVANVNSPAQIVISLKKEDKDRVEETLRGLGLKVVELAVSGGFHSPFMDSAKAKLKQAVDNLEFKKAKIPIVSNFKAKPAVEAKEIKENLIEQLVSPVLWKDCVAFMVGQGVDVFFEVGPSRVLKGLMRKIDSGIKVVNIEKKEDLEEIKLSESRF